MSNQMSLIIGYSLVIIFGTLAAYFFLRLKTIQAIFDDTSSNLTEERKRTSLLGHENQNLIEKLTKSRESAQKFEKQVDDLKAKNQNLQKATISKEQETKSLVESYQKRIASLEAQNESLNREVAEQFSQAKALEMQMAEMSRKKAAPPVSQPKSDQSAAKIRALQEKTAELQALMSAKDRELEQARKVMAELKPEDVKDAKRRASQYARLYEGMRGLRLMAEERNRNWENALGLLAKYIVKERKPDLSQEVLDDSTKIGPLVGEALEIIGATIEEAPNT